MAATGKTILIVEDDRELRQLYRQALLFAGFDVREAGDGVVALQYIDRQPPDLIVLDLMLPSLDGVGLLSDLAAQADTRRIPIVVVTGSNLDVSDSQANCVLRKPLEPNDLVNAVRRCLNSGAPTLRS